MGATGALNTVRLTLQAVAHGGDTLGRHEGKVIFVPYGIPDEEVTVEIVEEKKRFARGRLVEVHTPSPHRVTPPCPYFGQCGGCHWQHVAYDAQLEYKRQIVKDVLQRIGKIPNPQVRPVIGMDEPWRYRNNMRFAADRRGRLGLRARASHRVVPIKDCLILHPILRELYDALDLEDPALQQLTFRCGVRTGETMLVFEMREDQPPELEVDTPVSCALSLSDGRTAILVGSSHIHERVGDLCLRISPNSFFQVNTSQAETLIKTAQDYLEPTKETVLLDAYCGVGTFGLAMARHVAKVIGVEESSSAIKDARVNARGLDQVSLFAGRVEHVLPEIEDPWDMMVLDPPRAGCQTEVLRAVIKRAPGRIAYVSCDPATLARDLRVLVGGGYELRQVQPVDMFPQTAHVEAVALLTHTVVR